MPELSSWVEISMLRYLAIFLLLLAALDNLTNQQEVKGEQTKQLASYLTGFIPPPCNPHQHFYICKESYIHTNPST